MAEENLAIARRFFAALERGIAGYAAGTRSAAADAASGEMNEDMRLIWSVTADDLVWDAGDFGTYTGRVAIAKAWDDLLEVADSYAAELRELEDLGSDRVLGAVDRKIRAKGSGIEMTIPIYAVLTFEDGIIVRIDEALDREGAVARATSGGS